MKQLLFLLSFSFVLGNSQAQLIINELSQGPSGTKEYVELLVTGTPVCGANNTVDLRGWIIDDNNSWHATGSGTGIAGGHVRFDSIAQWASVKIGSLIVIYNDADTGSSIHALTVDTNDANQDLVYVIPISSSVLLKNITLPASNGSMTTYAVPGTTYSASGNWSVLGMANGGDAFHTVSPSNYTTAYHAIGWGNNSTAVNVYYSASQGGKVIYMANTLDNNPFNAANFVDTLTTFETPGAPNNAANAAWINSMTNGGQPFVVPTVTLNNPAPLTCGTSSTVIIATSNTTGANFVWSNGAIGANDTVTSGGVYTVTVSDAGSVCTASASVTINSSSTLGVSASSTSTSCGLSNGSASVSVTLGTATGYLWSNGGTNDSINNVPAGNYMVTVTGAGNCSATASVTVNSSGGNSVTTSANKSIFCPGDSAQICASSGHQSYIWNTGATTPCIYAKVGGNYRVTVTDNGTCTAVSTPITISIYPQPPVSISVSGDTLRAFNAVTYQWYRNNSAINGANTATYIVNQPGTYSVLVSDTNGCTALSNGVLISAVGLNELPEKDDFRVYPNPINNGHWNLMVGASRMGAQIEIFDTDGRLVYTNEINSANFEIDSDFAKGVYLLKLRNGEKIETKKLIKL